MSHPGGRVRHIDAGMMQMPGCCAICGSVGSEDGYADPQIYMEWYGNIYFCESCSVELAMFWNAVPEHEADKLKLEAKEANEEVLRLRAIVSTWEPLIEQLRVLNDSDPTLLNAAVSSVPVLEVVPEQSRPELEPEPDVSTDDSGEGLDDSEPIESVEDDGHSDVSELDSSDELIRSLIASE